MALPKWFRDFRRDYAQVSAASEALGEAVAAAGPLDEKLRELVKLGIAIGAGVEGGVHAHARRATEAGASADEVRHVGLLAISTIGFPAAMAGLSWIDDVIVRPKKKK